MTWHSPLAPIVLIEDNANDVYFVRRTLEQAHILNPLNVFETTRPTREYVQLATASGTPPVVVLVDLDLPGGESGGDFLRWLRMQPAPLGETPAVVLTGSSRPEDRKEAALLGALAFLQKPVTEERLSAALQALGFVIVTRTLSGDVARIIERR